MAEVGFIPERSETAVFIDTDSKSYNQITAEKVTKRDLVINFRKPYPGELAGQLPLFDARDFATFQEAARAVAALLDLAAVGVEDAVAEIGVGPCRRLDHQDLIAADAEMAVGEMPQLRRRQRERRARRPIRPPRRAPRRRPSAPRLDGLAAS